MFFQTYFTYFSLLCKKLNNFKIYKKTIFFNIFSLSLILSEH